MKWTLLAALLTFAPSVAFAVVIRHDVPDEKYRVEASTFPALVDLAHEGHGVLIAPQWIVTAAHATQWHPVTEVMVNGECLTVERLIVHPGYKPVPEALTQGDAAPLLAFLAGSDDIALIKLAKPVTEVTPVPLYRERDEVGQQVLLFGKGATGNGLTGQQAGPSRTELRKAQNVISAVEGRWLIYDFGAPVAAEPLEGMLGNGDSGGPVLMKHEGQWALAGIASWRSIEGPLSDAPSGLYGQRGYQVRMSHYLPWIDAVIEDDEHSGKD